MKQIITFTAEDFSIRDVERFWSRVNIINDADSCWEWQGNRRGNNYGGFFIKIGGKSRVVYAHRFSYTLANRTLREDEVVLHRCDNPRCVRASHLSAGSMLDNMQDASRKGRLRVGEASPRSKLTSENVVEIRTLLAQGLPQAAIARKFGVRQPTIARINTGKYWKHLPDTMAAY